MTRVFLDTNIVMDLLTNREPFSEDASRIFSLSERGEIKLFVSGLTIATTYYLVGKHTTKPIARKIVKDFRLLVSISETNSQSVDLTLGDVGFSDFEDGLQYYSAISSSCDIIITRDKKDFKNSKLPVMNPGQFLASIK